MALERERGSKAVAVRSPFAVLRLGFLAFIFAALVHATVPPAGLAHGFDGKSGAQQSDTSALLRLSGRILGSEAHNLHFETKTLPAGGAAKSLGVQAAGLYVPSGKEQITRGEADHALSPLLRAFDPRAPPPSV